jgi:hypothetical protein
MDAEHYPFAALFLVSAILFVGGLLGGGIRVSTGGLGVETPAPRSAPHAFMATIIGFVGLVFTVPAWVAWIVFLPSLRQGPGPGPVSTPSVVVTRAAAIAPSATAWVAPAATPGPSLTPTARVAPKPTAVPPVAPPSVINAGPWTHNLVVVSTTCGPPFAVGQFLTVGFQLQEVQPSDNLIADGEPILVRDGISGVPLYQGIFGWPLLQFRVAIPNGYRDIQIRYETRNRARARFEDYYPAPLGQCRVVLEERA